MSYLLYLSVSVSVSLCLFFHKFHCMIVNCALTLLLLNSGSQSNGEKASNVYNVGEQEQWYLSILGYVKAFSRQYASEVNTITCTLIG